MLVIASLCPLTRVSMGIWSKRWQLVHRTLNYPQRVLIVSLHSYCNWNDVTTIIHVCLTMCIVKRLLSYMFAKKSLHFSIARIQNFLFWLSVFLCNLIVDLSEFP